MFVGGIAVATQMDPKAFNADGSVRHAVMTVELPKFRPNQTMQATIVNGSGNPVAANSRFVDIPQLDVFITLKSKDGQARVVSVDLPAVAQDPKNAVPSFWINGPLAQERRFKEDVDDDLQVVFDVFTPIAGPARVDVAFHNDWTGTHRDDDRNYDVGMRLNGTTVYQATAVRQYPFSTWHHLIWTDAKQPVRVVPDLAELEAAAAVPRYATDFRIGREVSDSIEQVAGKLGDRPLGPAMVTMYMPNTGGRMDIGPLPTWAVVETCSMGAKLTRTALLANADAARIDSLAPARARDGPAAYPGFSP